MSAAPGRVCRLLFLAACIVLFSVRSHPKELADLSGEYVVDVWTSEDGLPQNSVTSIAQTPDGYLWLGTLAGVARFDGARFVVFDEENTPALNSSRIVYLHVDRQGNLWVRSEFGDLARWTDGRFRKFTAEDGLPPSGAGLLCDDPQGRLWLSAALPDRVFRLEGGRFIPTIESDHFPLGSFFGLTSDGEGNIWAGSATNLYRLFPGEPVRVETGEKDASLGILALGPSLDGGIWAATSQGIEKFRQARREKRLAGAEPITTASSLLEDRQGNVWVGTWGQGLLRFDSSGRFAKFHLTESSAFEVVRCLHQDHEGSLWAGVGGGGLYRLKPRVFKSYGIQEGLADKVVRSVAEDRDGRIWVLSAAGVNWIRPGQPDRVQKVDFEVPACWTVYPNQRGGVWIGTYANGLFRHDSKGLAPIEELRSHVFQALFEDRAGVLWAGSSSELFTLDTKGAGPIKRISEAAGVSQIRPRAIAQDRQGRVYLGLNRGGLLRGNGSEWTRFSKEHGLVSDRIWSLYVDRDDTVWIGTYGSGLSRFQGGRFFNFSDPSLKLPRYVTSILEDDTGYLWFGSNQGILRVLRTELNELAETGRGELNVHWYGASDGLRTIECVGGIQPAAWKARDGRLWFATVSGVSVVDPSRLPFNARPPPVVIEEVAINHEAVEGWTAVNSGELSVISDQWSVASGQSFGAVKVGPRSTEAAAHPDKSALRTPHSAVLQIPPGNRRLEIQYTALSFTAPEKVRFKYRLENLDEDWTDAGGRRTAYYQALRPGDYRFRVIACNNDGVWTDRGASLALTVLPHFWQTVWFRLLLALVGAGSVLALHLRRVRRLNQARLAQEAFSRQLIESQENERKRMAAELHDGLSQELLVMKNRALMGLKHGGNPLRMTEQFHEISTVATEAIRSVREIAQNLRPFQLDELGLTKAIEATLAKLNYSAGLQFRMKLDEVDGLFPPEFEIHFFRIVQECLNNIVKHSGATEAEVTVTKGSRQVRLVVRDNGKGFACPANATTGASRSGFGLNGLSERARLMGGHCEIKSQPGEGTAITVIIPLPRNHPSHE